MMSLGFVGFNCFDCEFDCFDDYHRKSDLFLLALVFVVVVVVVVFFVTLLFLLLIVRYLLEPIFFPIGNG